MGSQVGIWHFDGRTVSRNVFDRIRPTLEMFGPDGGDTIFLGSLGAAHRAYHTTSKRQHPMPHVTSEGDLVIWDGRMDNLDGQNEHCGDAQSEAAVVARRFHVTGIQGFSQILGDWALTIWDTRNRRLILARDYAGLRPLYYYIGKTNVVWASDVRILRQLCESSFELNDEWVSGFLGYGPSPNLTPFRGIYAVPPGCAVEIYDERMVITRFWLPDKSAQIKYKVDSEYEEHLRSLLRESVTARLRSEYNVWMHLSGGLDSSVLVGIADELAQSGVVPRMHDTVSCLYDLSPESDEFQFIAEVEKRRGRVGHHFNESAYPLLKEMDAVSADIPSYSQCFTYRERMICARMDELGARTQISGEGGDELLGNVLYGSTHVADLLHHGFIAQGVASAKIWGHCLKRSWLNILFQAFQQSLRLPDLFTKPSEFEEILTAEFCRRTNFRDRSLHTLDTIGFETPSGRQRSSAYLSVVRRLSQIPHRSFGNITTAYPYLHRPLVEFVLAIPADQLSRPGERRSLMRRAFRNVLPEKIWRRRSKRGPASALSIAAQREWNWIEAMLSNAIVFSRGYADERAVRTLARQVRHSIRPPVVLLQLLCLEAWLRDEQSWMPPQNRAVSSGWINA